MVLFHCLHNGTMPLIVLSYSFSIYILYYISCADKIASIQKSYFDYSFCLIETIEYFTCLIGKSILLVLIIHSSLYSLVRIA